MRVGLSYSSVNTQCGIVLSLTVRVFNGMSKFVMEIDGNTWKYMDVLYIGAPNLIYKLINQWLNM